MESMSLVEWVSIVGLGILPSLTWLVFYYQEDRKHPEPLGMILYAFMLGGIATFFVLVIQITFRFHVCGGCVAANHPVELLVFSAIEEIVKFLVVYYFISSRVEFDEPLDAMIYMAVAALGFAAVENVASLGQDGGTSLITGIDQIAKVELLALRFFGATLLHSLTSAIVGYHWGKAILYPRKKVKNGILIGLIIAIVLHAIFNYLILNTGPLAWVMSFVLLVGFFVVADFEELKANDV